MSLHEDLQRNEEIKGGTDRGFGLTVGGILLAIALIRIGIGYMRSGMIEIGWLELVFGSIGLALIIMGLVASALLRPLNVAWTKLGLLLFTIVNPIVLGVIFIITIVPIGLALRAFGKDPLRLSFEPEASSYWLPRDPPGPSPDSMKQQF
ncbi:MAG: SxtJ family membrane protein [Geminicoccales bacterium]